MSEFDQWAVGASAALLGNQAEPIVYTPVTGSPRNIQGIVTRNPPMVDLATQQEARPKMTVMVENNAVTGISTAEIDTGGDTITVAYRVGTTPQAYALGFDPNDGQTGNMITLELR